MSQRTERLDSQIRAELMDILQREMDDPRVGFATITRVDTAPDLSQARVWVSVLGTDDERARSIRALTEAAGWLRQQLGGRLRIRKTPRLEFRADPSIAGADRVLRLLHELDDEPGPSR